METRNYSPRVLTTEKGGALLELWPLRPSDKVQKPGAESNVTTMAPITPILLEDYETVEWSPTFLLKTSLIISNI